jgi:hypothetical protein
MNIVTAGVNWYATAAVKLRLDSGLAHVQRAGTEARHFMYVIQARFELDC